MSPDGQHQNQIDYVICSQRWRSSVQSVKPRPGADCGSEHELLIANFRLKLKKVVKTTRPFRYDLNEIPSRISSALSHFHLQTQAAGWAGLISPQRPFCPTQVSEEGISTEQLIHYQSEMRPTKEDNLILWKEGTEKKWQGGKPYMCIYLYKQWMLWKWTLHDVDIVYLRGLGFEWGLLGDD